MQYPQIIHHGAIKRVTGSCHQLCMDIDHGLLIDCGADNGPDDARLPEIALQALQAVVLTHVHNDHVGRLPALLAAGYTGPVLCSIASARLLPLVMEDILKHAGNEDSRVLDTLASRIVALPFDEWFELTNTDSLRCRLQLQRAGHILGSAYVECELHYPDRQHTVRVVFSGDLGACHTPILRSLRSPDHADILVLESTYGDRLHADRANRQARLERVIDQALSNGGTVLLPAFSIGRTQELLYELEDILHRKALLRPAQHDAPADLATMDWATLPIILDSPLASRFTRVYREFHEDWDQDSRQRLSQGRAPLGFNQLLTVDTHARHQTVVNYLASTRRPAIVIAGHGMCEGGRIVNYLRAMLEDAHHHVIFVGYQVPGTLGALIQARGPRQGYVKVDGQGLKIKAGVSTVPGYSAHADQQGLVRFVTGMDKWPAQIRLVHGEARAKSALGAKLADAYAAKGELLELLIPGVARS